MNVWEERADINAVKRDMEQATTKRYGYICLRCGVGLNQPPFCERCERILRAATPDSPVWADIDRARR